jgi:hypothetical protein
VRKYGYLVLRKRKEEDRENRLIIICTLHLEVIESWRLGWAKVASIEKL